MLQVREMEGRLAAAHSSASAGAAREGDHIVQEHLKIVCQEKDNIISTLQSQIEEQVRVHPSFVCLPGIAVKRSYTTTLVYNEGSENGHAHVHFQGESMS